MSDTIPRMLVPSLGSILGLGALGKALFVRPEQIFGLDGDVGRHIRVGRTILEAHTIPRVDVFSHTRAGEPFVPYEWLSEVMTALVHAAWGLPGATVMSALLFMVAVLGVYRATGVLGAPRLLAFLVALAALLLQSIHFLVRPHLFTTAFAAIFMVVLLRFARTGRAWTLAPLPLLMLFWANAHGGFLMGFVLLAAFTAGALVGSPEFSTGRRAVKALVVVLLLCALASLINPVGPELWRHTTGYLGIDLLVDLTHEYRSVDFHQPYGKAFFVALITGPVLWMTGRVRVTPLAAGLYLLFAAAALHSARNIPLFTVASMPWLAVWAEDALRFRGGRAQNALERMRGFETVDRRLVPVLPCLLGLAFAWYATGLGASSYTFDGDVFPVRAVQHLDGIDTAGPVFNQLQWGGYLLYARPEIPVFIDGQTDFYGAELSREYLATIEGAPEWRHALDAYGVAWTITPNGAALNQLLALDEGWELRYQDDVATIFGRTSPPAELPRD